jgi:hypothetical protein
MRIYEVERLFLHLQFQNTSDEPMSIRRDSTHSLDFSIRTVTPELNSHEFDRDTSGPVGRLSEAKFRYHIVTAGIDESPGQEIPSFHAPQLELW